MSMINKLLFGYVCLAMPLTGLGAQEGPVSQEETPAKAASPFGGKAVSEDALYTMTGQSDLSQVVAANNNAVVTGNSITGQSVTGTINIDGQAFQNMSGLSVLSANTGNNVSINASMNVNVAIHP